MTNPILAAIRADLFRQIHAAVAEGKVLARPVGRLAGMERQRIKAVVLSEHPCGQCGIRLQKQYDDSFLHVDGEDKAMAEPNRHHTAWPNEGAPRAVDFIMEAGGGRLRSDLVDKLTIEDLTNCLDALRHKDDVIHYQG